MRHKNPDFQLDADSAAYCAAYSMRALDITATAMRAAAKVLGQNAKKKHTKKRQSEILKKSTYMYV